MVVRRACLLVAILLCVSGLPDFMQGLAVTYLGTGKAVGDGDGGHRLGASMNNPAAAALSLDGSTLYFTDGYTNALRAVNRSNDLVWRVATGGGSALAVHPGNAFDVFVASGHYVRRFNGTPGAPFIVAGNGTGACGGGALKAPAGLAVNGSLLFVSDDCFVVRALDLATGVLSLYAGNGAPSCNAALPNGAHRLSVCLGDIGGLAVDLHSGALYIASTNRVVRVLANSSAFVVAGSPTNAAGAAGDGGPAALALLSGVGALALWRNLSLAMVVDQNPSRVRVVNLTTGVITTTFNILGGNTYSGDGLPATATALKYGSCLTVDATTGDAFVCERACPGGCRMFVVGPSVAPSQSPSRTASPTPSPSLSLGASPSPSAAAPPPWSAPCAPQQLVGDTASTLSGNGMTSTVNGNGAAASFNAPEGLCLSSAAAFVLDTSKPRVRSVGILSPNFPTGSLAGTDTAG